MPHYESVRHQITKLCKQDRKALVTCMFDYYALPASFPGFGQKANGPKAAEHIRQAFEADINQRNFIGNLLVHEFETLLFSDPRVFNAIPNQPGLAMQLQQIRNQFESPEHINDGFETAPSKRILKLYPAYKKVKDGSKLTLKIGLANIRQACPTFDAWLRRLEALA